VWGAHTKSSKLESLKREKMKNNNRYKEHDEKRRRIWLSVYKDQEKKLLKKYGKTLNASDVMEILLTSEFKIRYQKDDIELRQIIVQLKKIGNNVNQIATLSNQKKEVIMYDVLLENLNVIDFYLKEIIKKKNED
jgi:hypothetical protein